MSKLDGWAQRSLTRLACILALNDDSESLAVFFENIVCSVISSGLTKTAAIVNGPHATASRLMIPMCLPPAWSSMCNQWQNNHLKHE